MSFDAIGIVSGARSDADACPRACVSPSTVGAYRRRT